MSICCIEAGADINRQAHVTSLTDRNNADHPTGGFTPLMWAARAGNEAMVRRLVAQGANVNLKNGDDASAAMVAIYNDRFDVGGTLIELGSDVNDGSLYVAVEMRDADDRSVRLRRLAPAAGSSEHADGARSDDACCSSKGADPNKRFTGQFHSTSMPNSDRFDNTPFFRAAIAADVEALKVMVGARRQARSDAAGANRHRRKTSPATAGSGGRRGNPNAGRTAAMVAMTGGRGPAMTGGPGYIRDGAPPYREPGSRKPDEAFACSSSRVRIRTRRGPTAPRCCIRPRALGNLEMIRALAKAKVDFTQTNDDGFTALDVAEGKQPASGAGARAGGPPGGGRGRGRGASQQDVAKLLRELMGLPPAPPSTERARRAQQ